MTFVCGRHAFIDDPDETWEYVVLGLGVVGIAAVRHRKENIDPKDRNVDMSGKRLRRVAVLRRMVVELRMTVMYMAHDRSRSQMMIVRHFPARMHDLSGGKLLGAALVT